MKILPFTQEDLKQLPPLQPEGWSDLALVFREYLELDLCKPFKMVVNGRMAATGVLICFQNTVWLAHIIVDTDLRNQGMGFFMVEYLKGAAEKMGYKSVSLIATELGYPVYMKAGFTEQTRYLFFDNSLSRGNVDESKDVRPIENQDEKQVYAMDLRVSGENRSKLLSAHMKSGWVCCRNSKLKGFYLPSLGEGLVVAEDDVSGLTLTEKRIQVGRQVVVPEENSSCVRFLTQKGLTQKMTARRMIWGRPFKWHPQNLFSRIGGNFG